MPLARTADLLEDALARERAVGAFNVICLEHAEAIAMGAEAAGLPAILQISQNAVAFRTGDVEPIAAATVAVARAANVPMAVHLDHVDDDALLRMAAEAGFSSAMYDASKQPYARNLEMTRTAAVWAHGHGLSLEAELGEVGGKDGAHAPGVRTDPGEARAFVEQTGVDALAVAVGSSHAMLDRSAHLDQELIRALRDAVPVPLVLHGSSGVPDDELRLAVRNGITKVNVGTALNIALTQTIRERLNSDATIVDPRKYLVAGRAAMADVVARFLSVLA